MSVFNNQVKNQHLLWRAAFGPMAENANELNDISRKDLYHLLVKTSSKKPQQFNIASNLFDGLVKGDSGYWNDAKAFTRSKENVAQAVC